MPMKTAAAIMSFITALFSIAGVLCAVFMFENSFYARSRHTVKVNLMSEMLRKEAYRIADNYIDFNNMKMTEDFDERFSDSNLYYNIKIYPPAFSEYEYPVLESEDYQLIADNLNEDDSLCLETVNYTFTKYVNTDGSNYDEKYSDYNETAEYTSVAEVTLAVKKSLPANDKYSLVSKLIDRGYLMRYSIFVIILISIICTVILWIYLLCSAGRCDSGKLKISVFDRIPFDILFAAVAFVVFCTAVFILNFYTSGLFAIDLVLLFCAAVIVYFALFALVMNFASQIKKRLLIKGTVIYRILRGIYRILNPVFKRIGYTVSNINLILKTTAICIAVALAELMIILVFSGAETDLMVLWWMLGNAVLITAVLFTAVCLVKLKKGGEEIAGGNLDYKIDTTNMLGDFKRFGESLNNINEGMQTAVNEKMKSERMKTELITNVSHDIKTPLTSIINYVDLIGKEEVDNVKVQEYIGVLERQSNRLKKLIEDLVEASKASSGVLKVSLEKCNVCVLLAQATGEYEERFEAAGLKSVVSVPDEPIYIMADGRYLWRVFDNLMNNICKYTQPDTRVYINLEQIGERAVITFKNVSKYPLNISSDELMERFVRGDSSRSTEGSGLGLSIARSLTELQNGSFNIAVDGDLFKVMVSFPITGLS